jgi:hypothetical protein
MDNLGQPASASRHPRHRRHMLLIAVVLSMVAVAGASVSLAARDGSGMAPASPDGAAGIRPRAATPSLAHDPRVSLAGLAWADLDGVELPVSRSAGPRHMLADLAWGFSDTPLGALLAAVNIGVRASGPWGPGVFGPTIRDQVTGQGTGALLASCQAAYRQAARRSGVRSGRPLGRVTVAEEAFRWVTYAPGSAAVDIVSAAPGSQGATARAVTRIEVRWLGSDWRVIAPPGGDWARSAAVLTSLAGYTSFPPS